jgi:hypothetical protein
MPSRPLIKKRRDPQQIRQELAKVRNRLDAPSESSGGVSVFLCRRCSLSGVARLFLFLFRAILPRLSSTDAQLDEFLRIELHVLGRLSERAPRRVDDLDRRIAVPGY